LHRVKITSGAGFGKRGMSEEVGGGGWLMKGRMRGWEPPLPGPLLHKCVEERENTRQVFLLEPAVVGGGWNWAFRKSVFGLY
jgi:hypothetical protein